jgi:hypothetical protein
MIARILAMFAVLAAAAPALAADTQWRKVAMRRAVTAEAIDLVRSMMLRADAEVDAFVDTGVVIHRHAWIGYVDLDDDGVDEAIVLIQNRFYCVATGCWALVLRRAANRWEYMCGGPLDAWRHSIAVADRVQANGRRVFRTPHVIAWVDTGNGIVCYPEHEMRERHQRMPDSTPKPFPAR